MDDDDDDDDDDASNTCYCLLHVCSIIVLVAFLMNGGHTNVTR